MSFINKYPYTDFHEMNLDWFLAQFKELVSNWEDFKQYMEEEWDNVKQDWETLSQYVHDYFDNLDVQQEIDNKLMQMLLNGDLDEPIADAAGDWLLNHLATPSTPPIDDTLTIQNAAADSKAVGDRIASEVNTINTRFDTDEAQIVFNRQSGLPSYASAHGNLLANIADVNQILLADKDDWSDTPIDNNGMFINRVFSGTQAEQIFINSVTRQLYSRVVNWTDFSVIYPWIEYAQTSYVDTGFEEKGMTCVSSDLQTYAAVHDNNLAKVANENRVFLAQSAYWNDTPTSSCHLVRTSKRTALCMRSFKI